MMRIKQPIIRPLPVRSQKVKHRSWYPFPLRRKDSRPMFFNFVFEAVPRSLLPVHVQPDFLLAVRNGHIPLRRSKDDCFPRSRGAELFGEIYLDGQYGPLDGHLHVLHDRWPFSDGRSVSTPCPNNGATCTAGREGSQSTEARLRAKARPFRLRGTTRGVGSHQSIGMSNPISCLFVAYHPPANTGRKPALIRMRATASRWSP